MDPRRFSSPALIGCGLLLAAVYCCNAEKLQPDQKAPPFARGSGGLILKAPFEGGRPSAANSVGDEVDREETAMLVLVDGELVRTVKGHFSYKSPEGLPIFVKYEADENGNRASFKFGTGALEGGSGQGASVGPGGARGGAAGGPRGGPSGGRKDGTPTHQTGKNADRSYLPPQ